ncbi:prolyl aminopeptidase [Candidatus Woesearchaeota archaeon CG10_big_fil_rev_8_21_14_0_10_37_12]|nr:MAG: prolyl aminopeptidase [Candidatus Woesearchaeota archaeon CG10_big_fil_rev_8_21_14_0_10_37_12]
MKKRVYPVRKPYKSGYLPVSDNHQLYYALYGNPEGKPLFWVHGGPGAGSGNKHLWFDPKKFNVLTLDQRGSGKSKPFASTKNNTTRKLVEDMKLFLDFLKLKKVFLWGHSWGACLSLCFAIKHQEYVKGMLLSGVFLGTKEENDYFMKGGTAQFFPEVWNNLLKLVPKRKQNHPVKYYQKMMHSKSEKIAKKYCKEFGTYERKIMCLVANPNVKGSASKQTRAIAKLEAHYLLNDCFLPKNYIVKNINKIKHIPARIVHGRFDMVCPPIYAYELHKVLPKSKLLFTLANHSSSEYQAEIIQEIKKLVNL